MRSFCERKVCAVSVTLEIMPKRLFCFEYDFFVFNLRFPAVTMVVCGG